MKKPVVVLIVACLTVLVGGPLVLNGAADDLGFMLRTTPETPYGWSPALTVSQGTTAHTGTVEYAGGHRVPEFQGEGDVSPHGGGSLKLSTGTNQNTVAAARNPYLDGALVGGVDIEYSWFTEERAGDAPDSAGNPGGSATPGLRLTVTSTDAGRETLHYDPALNQGSSVATPFATWEREDAGPPATSGCEVEPRPTGFDDGCWWGSRTGPTVRFSLAQYAAQHPGARVVRDEPGGGFAVAAGSGTSEWANFDGYVDDVTLRRTGNDPTTTFDFEPTILTVWPGTPQGWTFTETPAANSTNPPSVSLVGGPGDPFFGTGSVRFAVGSNGSSVAEVSNSDLEGALISDIEALAYGTYVTNRPAGGACPEAPYLRLENTLVVNGAPVDGPTLIFHPCDQANDTDQKANTAPVKPGVPLNTWQRWDAAHGTWRWTETNAVVLARAEDQGVSCADGVCMGTLEQYYELYPGDETAGELAIGAGGADTNPNGETTRWANFVGHADFLTRDHGDFLGRTYDFEAQAPPPPATTTTTDPNAPTTSTTTGGSPTTTTPRRTTTTTQGSGTTTSTTRDPNDPGAQVSRLDGADRLATAVDISQADFGDDEAGAVVLARADNYPDALAATPLAGARRGPLLLTFPDSLDSRVENEVRRVLPPGGTVHLAGGPVAIGSGVETRLRADGFNVVRHSGRNRFETATLLAEQISQPAIAFLATGLNFPDALPAGAAAIGEHGVVLLTADSSMPPETVAYLNARPGLRRFAVGGQAAAADPGSERAVGNDRFETAVAVARRFFGEATSAAVASGTNYPDALAGGAHVGSRNGPLLLTRPESLPAPVRQWLAETRETLRDVFIYGGPNAVSTSTENEIRSAVS